MATGYDAFISYSHAADGKLAPALQTALQRFAKPWYRLRALHLFRDQTSLSATPGLWPAIEAALQSSRYFLLLASPEAAQSRWVQQEVAWWLEHKSPQTLLIALTDGKIVRHPGAKDFDWAATDALPPTLQGVFTENPLWVDFRWAQGQEHLSTKNPEFQNALAALAAPLRNIPKENLIGEDVRQHRRALLLARGAVVVLVVLLILAGWQWREAVQQRDRAEREARIAQSRLLETAAGNLGGAQTDLSLLLSLEANRLDDTVRTRGAMLDALAKEPRLVRFFRDHPGEVREVALTADGRMLATGGTGGLVLWDVASGQPLGPALAGPQIRVLGLGFSPDGTTLASAGEDGTIALWDVSARRLRAAFPAHDGEVWSIAFSPDGRTLASGGLDDTVALWEVEAGRLRARSAPDQPGGVADVAFSPDGSTLASVSREYTFLVRDPVTAAARGPAISLSQYQSLTLAYWDATTVALGGALGQLVLWDLQTNQPVGAALSGHTAAVGSLAVDAERRLLASASMDGSVVVWDGASGVPLGAPIAQHTAGATDVVFGPDGTFVTGSLAGTVALWTLDPVPRPARVLARDAAPVSDLAFSPDGASLGRLNALGEVALVDETGRERVIRAAPDLWQEPESASGGSLAFAPDGSLLVVAFANGTVLRFDDAGNAIDEPLGDGTTELLSAAVGTGPDGPFIAVGRADGAVARWHADGRPLGEPLVTDHGAVHSVAVSADGRLLAAGGGDGVVTVWDAATGRRVKELAVGSGRDRTTAVFGPGGETLAASGPGGAIALWDVDSWRRRDPGFPALSTSITDLAISPDGRLLAAGLVDGAIVLLDAATGQQIGPPLRGHDGGVWSVAFSPDGRSLASGGQDEPVLLWDLDLAAWRERACALAARNLTRDEWARYFAVGGRSKTCSDLPFPEERTDASPVAAVPPTTGPDVGTQSPPATTTPTGEATAPLGGSPEAPAPPRPARPPRNVHVGRSPSPTPGATGTPTSGGDAPARSVALSAAMPRGNVQ